jgi:hypothetical protein
VNTELLDLLSDCQLLKKDSAALSWLQTPFEIAILCSKYLPSHHSQSSAVETASLHNLRIIFMPSSKVIFPGLGLVWLRYVWLLLVNLVSSSRLM